MQQPWLHAKPAPLSGGICLFVGVLTLLQSPESSWGQALLANVQGVVKARESGRPLASVTVVVTGPALQGLQSEVTDAEGRYVITQLPPGDGYEVRFFFGADEQPRLVRSGLRLSLGQAVTVDARLGMSERMDHSVIVESAPNVDTAGSVIGAEIGQELLQNTPMRGRTAESALALAPAVADVAPRLFGNVSQGPAGGEVGVSISGATGSENLYIIDGVSTTDPKVGLIGSELSQYFIKELSVLAAGYQAEFGRATGGVVTIATKSGSNELHGSIFGSLLPYQLDPPAVARLGEALSLRQKQQVVFDLGFELGGALVKDRVWFYLGYAPTVTRLTTQLSVRQQIYDETTGQAKTDPGLGCPGYLSDSLLCLGTRRLALATQELDGAGRDLLREKQLHNFLTKLDFRISPAHSLTIGYLGSPTSYDDYRLIPGQNVDVDGQKYSRVDQLHDLNFHYLGKLLARRLQLDVRYGYHYQRIQESPEQPSVPFTIYYVDAGNPYSLSDFEDIPACRRQMGTFSGMSRSFNPCPITQYLRGFGYMLRDDFTQRHSLLSSATAYLHLAARWNPLRGVHALKFGFDFDATTSDNLRGVTGTDRDASDPSRGHRSYFVIADGTLVRYNESAQRDVPSCKAPLSTDTSICPLDAFRGLTQTRNFTVYLRDSWQVGWAPGLVVNLGLRWEAQELYAMAHPADPEQPRLGEKSIAIYDNWAPRIGLVYDFTQQTRRPGRGKLFAHYGRYYESLPLSINDREFTGGGFYASGFSSACPDKNPQGRRLPDVTSPDCRYPAGTLIGGTMTPVAPVLKGQYLNEFVAGASYELGFDIVAGISYVHRDLGNIIEDISTNGGLSRIIANPGQPAEPGAVQELEAEVRQAAPSMGALPVSDICRVPGAATGALGVACNRYVSYLAAGTAFIKPQRDYNALILTLSKRLSSRFSMLCSYTYSRTIGNYPGTYNATKGQLEPNLSTQYDLSDLLVNRRGPLPTDRPHNFKATGFFEQRLSVNIKLTLGATFTAISGRPIEVLGSHLYYGANEVFILPRGSGGRTPTVTQFDLQLGYVQQLSPRVQLACFISILNLFNQQQVTNVEDSYTFDPVAAIVAGRPSDLLHLRTVFGTRPSLNSNYGQPTAFQEPMYFRAGGRLSF